MSRAQKPASQSTRQNSHHGAAQPAQKTVFASVAKLKPHPRQDRSFPPDEANIARLYKDIGERGVQVPLEVTPDFVVICGHCRLAAAKQLGLKVVPVIVRYDMPDANDPAVWSYMVRDNVSRRQLSPVAMARCARDLAEIKTGRPLARVSTGREELKASIARDLNVDVRTVSRWLRLLELPAGLQSAVDTGEIGVVEGGKIASWPEQLQKQLVEQIANGVPAKSAIKALLPNAAKARKLSPVQVLDKACKGLRLLFPTFESLTSDLNKAKKDDADHWLMQNVISLTKAIEVIRPLSERAQRAEKAYEKKYGKPGDLDALLMAPPRKNKRPSACEIAQGLFGLSAQPTEDSVILTSPSNAPSGAISGAQQQ